jgi:hypothetical protein
MRQASFPSGSIGSARRAVVVLTNGYWYEGVVQVTGPWVNFSGKRRIGKGDDVQYYATPDHTWPHAKIDEIKWIDGMAV